MIKIFFAYLPSTLIPRLATFLTVLFGAHLMSTEQFGYLSLTSVIAEFADTAISNWIRIAVVRFGRQREGVSHRFMVRMAALAIICTMVALALCSIAIPVIAPETRSSISIAVTAYIVSAAGVRFGVALQMAAGKHLHASFFESARALIGFSASLAMMFANGGFLEVSLVASASSFVTGTFAVISGFRATNQNLTDQISFRTLLFFATPLLIIALLAQLIGSLDKILLLLC